MVNFNYNQFIQKNISVDESKVVNELYGSLLNGYIKKLLRWMID